VPSLPAVGGELGPREATAAVGAAEHCWRSLVGVVHSIAPGGL